MHLSSKCLLVQEAFTAYKPQMNSLDSALDACWILNSISPSGSPCAKPCMVSFLALISSAVQ